MKKIIAAFIVLVLVTSLFLVSTSAQPVNIEKLPVIIVFKDHVDEDLVRYHGGKIKAVYHTKPALATSLSQEAIYGLRMNPNIAYIVEDLEVFLMEETLPWGVDRIDADVVHGYNKGVGVNIAIMDTGMDYNHPDLAVNYRGGYDFAGATGADGDPDPDPMDFDGHGTHCAGIVAAVVGNGMGVIGVAPEANLYALKVFSDDGDGYYSDVILALEWCIDTRTDGDPDNDIQVISMSFGSSYYAGDPGIKPWIDEAYAAGILLVGSAGNEGNQGGGGDNVIYPARYDSVIAVGATDDADRRSSWSSTGHDLELMAPGVSIYSTYWDDTYSTLSGTSMACPHVTGTAALVIAGEGLTNVDVRLRLRETADDLGPAGFDTRYGYGLVDADEAAPAIDTTPPVISAVTSSDLTSSSATISWTTDEESDSVVNYGTDTSLGNTALDASLVTSHSIALTGLMADTTYYYEVQSTDSAGNTAIDNNGGSYYTFTTLAPDTEPPSTITDLSAVAGAYPDIDLTWTAATDNMGVDHYNVYRNTLATIDKTTDLLATVLGAVNSYIDSTGAAETTYYYAVCAVDAAGNEAELSNIASATVAPTPSNTMHVASIDMSLGTQIAGKNTFTWAIATVTIVDAVGDSVEGATVSVHWEGATTDSDSGVTDANGQVALTSRRVKGAPSGTIFTFVVDDVILSGVTYDPTANVETSDSITV